MKSHGLDPEEAHRDFLQSTAAGLMAELDTMTPEQREAYLKTLDPEAPAPNVSPRVLSRRLGNLASLLTVACGAGCQLRAEVERQLQAQARQKGGPSQDLGEDLAHMNQASHATRPM